MHAQAPVYPFSVAVVITMHTNIPEDVRTWWREQFRTKRPFSDLLADARKIWPDRECGADAVVVMYGAVNELEVTA